MDQKQAQPQGQGQPQGKPQSQAQASKSELEVSDLMTGKGYVEVVKYLQSLNPKDSKTLEFIKTLQGDPKNDNLEIEKNVPLPVIDMIPTQNEIDFTKSLKFPLVNPPSSALESTDSVPASSPGPLVIANIGGVNYIVDGHHRWSGIFLVNPKGSLLCHVIKGFSNPTEALKATQLAVMKAASLKGKPLPSSDTDPNAINLLDPSTSEESFKNSVKQTIEKGSNKEAVMDVFRNNGQDGLDAIADYIWENLLKMRNDNKPVAPKPDRVFMPQTSGDYDDKKKPDGVKLDLDKDVIDPLDKGLVNVKSDFTPGKVEAQLTSHQFSSKKWIKTFEQFKGNR